MADHDIKKGDLAEIRVPEDNKLEKQPKTKTIKEASVSEIISFSKFTLSGVVVFIIGLVIQAIFQRIQFDGYERWVLAVIGVSILVFFGGLVVDILNWRKYTEWGALGAIISYFGVFLIFIPFILNLFWYSDAASFVYIIMFAIGVITIIIGLTTRATELDQKIVDQFFLFKEWVKAGGIRQALSALKQLIATLVKGFFRYIWIGIKELGTRIKRFAGWVKRSIIFFLRHTWTFITKTFPNVLKQTLTGFWNNLHWLGLIAIILYLIMFDIPIPTADPLVLKVELMIIISFFFCLGVLYPQRDRVVLITKRMRHTVLAGVISAYSMLSGTKINVAQSVFCSRCLRGVATREFQSLIEIKGMQEPPCPFCGCNNWIGSEQVSVPLDKIKRKEEQVVQTTQKSVAKDTLSTEIIITNSDKKALKKGKFPNFPSYQRAQNVGAQTYSELEYIDRLGAPDFTTAEKIKKGGFAHFETYKKALTVGASSVSELSLIEDLQAPDLATAEEIQQGGFPDYGSYKQGQDLGAKTYYDLKLIKRFGAPDFDTVTKIRKGGFPNYKSYQEAQKLGARTYSELEFRSKMGIKSTDVDGGVQVLVTEEQRELKPKPVPSTDIEIHPTSQFVQEAEVPLIPDEITKKEVFKLTEDRESLIQAIEIFESILDDHTLKSKDSEELIFWNKKKIWFLNQKRRFLRGNISTGMFYNKMKSLNKDLRSTFRIPEERFSKIESEEKLIENKSLSSEKGFIDPKALKKPVKNCPQCQYTNESTYTYCINCGFEFPNNINTR